MEGSELGIVRDQVKDASRKERIIKLRLRGFSLEEIARATKLSRDEVEHFINELVADFNRKFRDTQKEIVLAYWRRSEEILKQLYELRQKIWADLRAQRGDRHRLIKQFVEIVRMENEVVDQIAKMFGIKVVDLGVFLFPSNQPATFAHAIKEVEYVATTAESPEQEIPARGAFGDRGNPVPLGDHPTVAKR